MLLRMQTDGDHTRLVRDFMHEHGLHKVIAFSGGADSTIPGVPEDDPLQTKYKEVATEREARVIGEALQIFSRYRVAILTGGTRWGVPKTATTMAKKLGIKTFGVFPQCGEKHWLGENEIDLSICVESSMKQSVWGDESPVFSKLLDGVIVYGGSAGTMAECAHLLKLNEAYFDKTGELKEGAVPKYMVPIAGTGGVASGLHSTWSKPPVRRHCMPFGRISSGIEAANLLVEKLNLDDYPTT